MTLILPVIILTAKGQDLVNQDALGFSLQNYENIKPSPATGLPQIEIPLYNLETTNDNVSISLFLSYHYFNGSAGMPISEVGRGWTLFKGAMISKENSSDNDEYTEIDDLTKFNSDRYYYNIPGHTGKFQIYKDPSDNNIKVHYLTADNVKIEFVRDVSSSKLLIDSFSITDAKGIKYSFDKYNLSSFQRHIYHPYLNFRSTYLVTTISDANNIDLVNYSYDVKTKYVNTPNAAPSIKYKINKLNTITTNHGKLKFEYAYDQSGDDNNAVKDFYPLNSVSLLSNSNITISKYKFYSDQYLGGIRKFDRNESLIENTNFSYASGTDTSYENLLVNAYSTCPEISDTSQPDPKTFVKTQLSEIWLPTGGHIKYDYEANETFADRSNDPPITYYTKTDSIDFDTNVTRTYSFEVDGDLNQNYFIMVSTNHFDGEDYGYTNHGQPIQFNFSVLNSNNAIVATANSFSDCESGNYAKYYRLRPGIYTFKINNWGGKGKLEIVQPTQAFGPFKNTLPVKGGARVKRITHYDNYNEIVKQTRYEYNSFSDLNSSSGYGFIKQYTADPTDDDNYVIYKNVREIQTAGNSNNGYIDYYYDTPLDYFTPSMENTWPHYNLLSQGLLKEKKIFNHQNNLVQSESFTYNFLEVPNSEIDLTSNYFHKPSMIQKINKKHTIRRDGFDFSTLSEEVFDTANKMPIYSKLVTHNGDISETTTKYAGDLSDVKLINANMVSVPLETIISENGNILSTKKTNYSNNTHNYPTSLSATDLLGNPETQVTFDLYDNKGNLIQVTDKSGISTTTIYGYGSTLPIAKIVGAKYSDISSLPEITQAVLASGDDASNPLLENDLIATLETLRLSDDLKQYQITTYTYDPLVGVTNVISPNGLKVSYTYDASGRLITVKDSNGKVLKENQYNLKH